MRKILLVSDDKRTQLLLNEEFEDGYQVLTVSNRKEALSLLAKNSKKPDLVILDLSVPEKSGIDTLGHILKQKFRLPVIIFPAYSIFRKDALRTEIDTYRVRSSDISALRKKVHDLI
jgi:DNA-binding response OmpR family regulator